MNHSVRLSTVDLPALITQLSRASIGFDHLFNELNRNTSFNNNQTYPPHDIVKHSETSYTIELACAGFKEDELEVTVEDGLLTISGNQFSRPEKTYIHQGISGRSFSRTLKLAEHVEIGDATFENGLLIIQADIVLPEELKPRKISIKGTAAKQVEVK